MRLGCAAKSPRLVRAKRRTTGVDALCGATVLWITACGQPNPKILSSQEDVRGGVAAEIEGAGATANDRIVALIDAVRTSEHTFVVDGIERKGPATADKLQLLLDRDVAGVRNAKEFITRIAAPDRDDEAIDRVITGPEDAVPLRSWLRARLAEIEGKPLPLPESADGPPAPADAPPPDAAAISQVKIFDALMVVERSGLKFLSPPRKHVVGPRPKSQRPPLSKRKPKTKEYTSREFADMLRKKWEFLGADIDDLPTFMDEIGSESFAAMTPYLVVHPDGTEQEFRPWLESELAKQAVLAQGGTP
jgi:hypothetical protein